MLATVRKYMHPVIILRSSSKRSSTKQDLHTKHHGVPFFENFGKCIEHIIKYNSLMEVPIVVCGSVFAVGEVLQYIYKFQPHDVHKFQRQNVNNSSLSPFQQCTW